MLQKSLAKKKKDFESDLESEVKVLAVLFEIQFLKKEI